MTYNIELGGERGGDMIVLRVVHGVPVLFYVDVSLKFSIYGNKIKYSRPMSLRFFCLGSSRWSVWVFVGDLWVGVCLGGCVCMWVGVRVWVAASELKTDQLMMIRR